MFVAIQTKSIAIQKLFIPVQLNFVANQKMFIAIQTKSVAIQKLFIPVQLNFVANQTVKSRQQK